MTEFVDGPTLAQWIRRSTLTESQTARLGAAMCRTLAYIHARGIVHCDIKPANILISGRSEDDLVAPKLADFGIATAGNSTRLTTNGATIGTANYLSPEQVRGERITAATDIYSLGLVLIEALTGALAYPGTGVDGRNGQAQPAGDHPARCQSRLAHRARGDDSTRSPRPTQRRPRGGHPRRNSCRL